MLAATVGPQGGASQTVGGSTLPTSPTFRQIFTKSGSAEGLYICSTAGSWTGPFSAGGGISGLTTNTIPKATSATTIGDSSVKDDGTQVSTTEKVAIGQATASAQLDILAIANTVGIQFAGTQQGGAGSTAASSALSITGAIGQANSGTGSNAGAGAPITITSGIGGAQTGVPTSAPRTAGAGGQYTLQAGGGGEATGGSTARGRGGVGGSFSITGGTGGATNGTGANSFAGAGGGLTIGAGDGGVASTAFPSGNGGALTITAGGGGANSIAGGIAGTGGAVTLDSGAAGSASGGATAGANGAVNLGTTNASSVNLGNATGAVSLYGTATNNAASSGQVGELLTASLASGSATSLSTGTAKTITSVSLTAGDWDVWGVVDYVPAATTTTAYVQQGASTTTNTLGAQDTFSACSGGNLSGTVLGSLIAENTPMQRMSLASTTTVYLIGLASFAVSTMTSYGSIFARRRR